MSMVDVSCEQRRAVLRAVHKDLEEVQGKIAVTLLGVGGSQYAQGAIAGLDAAIKRMDVLERAWCK